MITMSKRVETSIFWLLLATCTEAFVHPMQAQAQQPPPFVGIIPNLPGQLPPPLGGIIPNLPGQLPPPLPLGGITPNLPGQLPSPLPLGGIIPNLPGQLPQRSPTTPVDIRQCWSALTNIQGCLFEIYRSAISSQFDQIGPDCCRAINTVTERCWPKMFPLVPLKNHCAGFKATPPTPK